MQLSLNQATVPVQLGESSLEPGTLAEIDRQLNTLPEGVRRQLIRAAQEGMSIQNLAQPEYATSVVPEGALDSALSSAFPYGSAGEPIRPLERTRPINDESLQKRFDAVNKSLR